MTGKVINIKVCSPLSQISGLTSFRHSFARAMQESAMQAYYTDPIHWARVCKENDIWLGSYYSNLDWYHPDWEPQKYGGPGDLILAQEDSPNLDRYF